MTVAILLTTLTTTYFFIRQNIQGAKTTTFLLFFGLLSLALTLFVKFFYFKNKTIAWFVLVLSQLCVIIYLYYIDIIDDNFWPLLVFVPAVSNLLVFCHGEATTRFLTNILLAVGTSALMCTKGVLPLGYAVLLGLGMAVVGFVVEKIICVLRRYYGEV